MKKILLMIAVILMAISADAQVQFGVRGGLNVSKESDQIITAVIENGGTEEINFSNDMKWRAGVNVGGFVNIPESDMFDLEIGLSYSMLGYNDKIIEIDGRGEKKLDHNVTSHYLTIPVAEKFYPTGKGFYLELGPQLGILLSKKATVGGGDSYTPFKDDNRTLDFGILGGVGYVFPNGMFLNGRYIHGLTETCKIFSGGKNRNLQLSLGYLF
ncbi:MAG: PorT family protein [Bacteroidaceae bacterium]|nr:PorT family protein [Bacteroidaceae bacterium]